ncbi:CoA-binding protein [Chloroflexota bacterium]
MKVDFSKLDRAFNPKCIAVVGDKGESNFIWLRSQSNFKGKLYSVQIDPREIEGIKALGVENYPSLLDVPEPVDLVIVAVPRAIALMILEDCIHKEVAAAHFFTAGFSETNTEEGKRLERLLTERAEQANFHLIGPNCMGIFNPSIGVMPRDEQYAGFTGQVGFISQSGTHAVAFTQEAHLQGMDINKAVSFGNGVVLDSTDYLEYFGHDPEIKVIGIYLEGVKDGRRFFKLLREVSARKPVVVWKGGRTEEGARAIASHTASLAIPRAIWDAAVKQCGTIQVNGLEELIDTLKAILYLPPVCGDRSAVAGGSGGQSVAIADVFVEAGLKLPMLTQKSYDELATFFSLIGGSYLNPIDTGNPNSQQMNRILDIIERDANIDNLVFLLTTRSGGPANRLEAHCDSLIEIKKRTSKPVMAILSWSFSSGEVKLAGDTIQKLKDGGVPTFISLERGAFALRKALDYYKLKNGTNTQEKSLSGLGDRKD